ncbi:FAD binding domain containing protein [Drepanopeziza brunnea f. sp. 'multigermtubi' MB_m1]|uniref:FAD binding domain containing protein n=2 Tax=Drepanopeziza brunnea f. sp. 'multigermtubi' TaxID=698441 RepID=K1W7C4_MARBU|nr:FAD binding domain containing protein [Drepanopeziza brunnea f. sp. 'multigermtubi' MB_m1]EKD12970.1 FAD binding domain containing protein [Drepanopeziza brunnea f. sp. 'multigermtubi' MB_m1]
MATLAAAACSSNAEVFASSKTCCNALREEGSPSNTFYPDQPGYNASMEGFWSLQTTFDTPSCIVKPRSSQEVATTVQLFARLSCKFSIKGGGHTPWAGAASISDGVTIDMTDMSDVALNANKTVARIGAGARFGKVYRALEEQGMMVAAGRDANVGFGGLVLGGGFSWFTSTMGLVADGLVNIELVTGDGKIINANASSNADLFQGLKGGGNNFGVVTRYDLKAFEFSEMWGGLRIYPNTTQDQQIDAFVNFTNNLQTDTNANIINFSAYSAASGLHLNWNFMHYTKPIVDPPIYAEFDRIPGKLTDSTRIATVSNLTAELGTSEQRARNLFLTLSFANDAAMYKSAVDISNSYLNDFLDTPGLLWVQLFQPINTIISKASVANGGNIMGVDRNKDNIIMYQLFLTWDNDSDDEDLINAAYASIEAIKAKTVATGTDNPFIYLNYAGKFQDPLGGYGKANVAKLAQLSAKYDPNGVFQRLVPGGFKIANANPTTP